MESAGAVDVTAFLNITGQVIYSKIMEAYLQEAFVMIKRIQEEIRSAGHLDLLA